MAVSRYFRNNRLEESGVCSGENTVREGKCYSDFAAKMEYSLILLFMCELQILRFILQESKWKQL
jgi:hypothetical protein